MSACSNWSSPARAKPSGWPKTRLREGTVDLVTVLQTQQTLFTAEDQHVVARLARLQAVLSLFQALGGAWLPPGVAAGDNVVR